MIDSRFTPVWSEYAKKCLSLLQECSYPYWCWTLFLTPLDQLLKQPDYETEILTPITWMMIEVFMIELNLLIEKDW